ncbi:hypothetical protein K438DRAFT_1989662 [Mycena galopus ATCC 62051]|nr:hypothetical protein K438DRAFT_1989657 [Mycena galopus ATCC 62051]KAF8147432.1 hypothetical protein K438DRAFT_1989662 [Mycena galopus ATCC 62051]
MLKKRHERHAARAAWAQPLYFAFDGQPNDAPLATGTGVGAVNGLGSGGIWPKQACGNCSLFMDASTWNDTVKAGVQQFALASMDATQDSFFWTWKVRLFFLPRLTLSIFRDLPQIGAALNGVVQSPLWSYSLGLENGFMPTHPRDSIGVCAAFNVYNDPFNGTFQSWQTGGAGAGTIAPSDLQSFGAWPPSTLSSVTIAPTLLPTYTPTAAFPSLTFITPTPSITAAAIAGASASASRADAAAASTTASVGSGWFGAQDTLSVMTPVAGCTYPDAWSALSSTVPPPCTGTTVAR